MHTKLNILRADRVSTGNLPAYVREVERRSQIAHQTKQEIKKTISPDIRRLNDVLTERLGVNAEVKTTNHKKGKIVLHFDTPETFEYLLKQLGIDYQA